MYVSKSSIDGNTFNDFTGGNIYFNGSGGTYSSSPDIYIDGIPLIQSIAYNYNYNIINAGEISEISVLKNSTPLLGYGTSAAGLIDINTIEMHRSGFYDELNASLGTFSEYMINYINACKVKNISSFLSVRYQGNASDEKKYGSDNSFLSGRYKMGITLNSILKLYIGGSLSKDLYKNSYTTNIIYNDSEEHKEKMTNLRTSAYITLKNNSRYISGALSAYFNYNDVDNIFSYNSKEKYFGVIFSESLKLQDGTNFLFGADYRGSVYNLERNNINYLNDYMLSDLAIFCKVKHAIIDNAMFLTGSIRYSHNVNIKNELLPEIGFEAIASKNIFISAKFSKGYGNANIYDKYILYPGFSIDNNLSPEKYYSYTSTVGFASNNNRFKATINMGIKKYNNKIGYIDNCLTNIEDVYSISGDASLNINLTKRSLFDFNYSYTKYDNCTVYAPQSILRAGYTLAFSKISFRVNYEHIEKLNYLMISDYSDSYSLLGAKINLDISKNININFSMNNILSEEYLYSSGMSAPGLCWQVGFSISH